MGAEFHDLTCKEQEVRTRTNAQDMDIDGCKALIGEMTIQMFEELKRVAKYPINDSKDRIVKIHDVIRLEYEICDNIFTKFVLTDVAGTVENYIKEVCPLEQKDKDNYEIKDKRTGVRFISYLQYGEAKLLSESKYLKITKIETEEK